MEENETPKHIWKLERDYYGNVVPQGELSLGEYINNRRVARLLRQLRNVDRFMLYVYLFGVAAFLALYILCMVKNLGLLFFPPLILWIFLAYISWCQYLKLLQSNNVYYGVVSGRISYNKWLIY